MKSITLIGQTEGGKSNTAVDLADQAIQDGDQVLCLDVQARSTGWLFIKKCIERNVKCILDDYDDNKRVQPIHTLRWNKSPKVRARRIKMVLESVAAYRGYGSVSGHPQVMHYIKQLAKLVMGQKKHVTLAYAANAFIKNSPQWRRLINNCRDREAARFFKYITTSESILAPSKRAMDIATGETFVEYDRPGPSLGNYLSKGYSWSTSGGSNVTAEEQRFMNFIRMMEAIDWKIRNPNSNRLWILIEESNVTGLPVSFVRWVLQAGAKLKLHGIILAQNTDWPSNEFDVREMVFQNTDLFVFRCSDFETARRCGRLLNIDASNSVRRRNYVLRERIVDYQQVEVETEGKFGKSVTKQFMPVRQPYYEQHDQMYYASDAERDIAGYIMEQPTGFASVRCNGKTMKCQFPLVTITVTDSQALEVYRSQKRWEPARRFNAGLQERPVRPNTQPSSANAPKSTPKRFVNNLWIAEKQSLSDYLSESE